MKRFLIFNILYLLLQNSYGQITITKRDMPVPNDTFVVNVTNQFPPYNLSNTGADYTWDYSNLIPAFEREDIFYSPWQTPPVYWLFFNAFNVTTAMQQSNDIRIGNFLTISDIYNFHFSSNSRYELTGFGALINGIPTPVKYDTNDVWYQFPLNYLKKDTSFSVFDVNIPNIGYWKSNQKRCNFVDGWGKLILPTDTFEVLRVKSEIWVSDSVRLDTLGGFSGRFNRPKTTEYKFLAKDTGIPVLHINTQTNQFGFDAIVSIEYQSFSSLTSRNTKFSHEVTISPQPANGEAILDLSMLSGFSDLSIYDMRGNLVREDKNITGKFSIKNLESGIYFLTIKNFDKIITKKLIFTN